MASSRFDFRFQAQIDESRSTAAGHSSKTRCVTECPGRPCSCMGRAGSSKCCAGCIGAPHYCARCKKTPHFCIECPGPATPHFCTKGTGIGTKTPPTWNGGAPTIPLPPVRVQEVHGVDPGNANRRVKTPRVAGFLKNMRGGMETLMRHEEIFGEEWNLRMARKNLERIDERQVLDLLFATVKDDTNYVGIAWALRHKAGSTLVEQRRCLERGVDPTTAQYTALIEGLQFALAAGVRSIRAFGNSEVVYDYVFGRTYEDGPILSCIDRVKLLGGKLKSLEMQVASVDEDNHMKGLAKMTLASYLMLPACSPRPRAAYEDCPICCETVPAINTLALRACSHKICGECLSRYMEVQIEANKVPVRCPQECLHDVDLDQCRQYLSTKIVKSYERSLTEASIPESERVYCPFAACSALMLKDNSPSSNVASSSENPTASSRECMECHRVFCVKCNVPWHSFMTCEEYQKLSPEDAELYRLVKEKRWQRCKQCHNVVELRSGCYHITCRCGHEFCYLCGAPWKNKMATCKCKLFDEHNR